MKDLTKGNPFKQIFLFALPVFGGNIFHQLYSMADAVVVGNTVNADALTGVGLTGGIGFLIFGFVSGLTSGFGVTVAQRFGAHDEAGVRRAVASAFTLSFIVSVLLTAVCAPLAGVFLRLTKTPEQFFAYAYYYLLITLLGIGANVLYNVVAAVLRAIGDSKTPLLFLILSTILNVGLDFAFILGLRMYYCGVALATVLSQLLSGAACIFYMLKRYPALRLKCSDFRWDSKLVGVHLAVGIPMALQFSITAIGIIFRQTALNTLDVVYPGVVTACAAAAKVDGLASLSFPALGVAMATFAGQNKGAGDMGRVKRGVLAGMTFVVVFSVVGIAFSMGLYRPIMKLFVIAEKGGDAALYYDDMFAYAKKFLLIQSGCYLFLGTVDVLRNALQGIGKSLVTVLAGVTELAGRALACFLFTRLWGFTGVCFTDPVAWLAADIFLAIVYFVVLYSKPYDNRPQEEKEELQTECGDGLTSITIPNSVTSIGEGEFYNFSGLTNITIPESVTSIGDYAFSGCSGLTSVTFAENSQLTSIGDNAFAGCSALTSITIPNSVTSIGDYAFAGCSGLTNVTFAENSQLTSIGSGAFRDCRGLTSITISNSVTGIRWYAFQNCSGLTRIDFNGTKAQWAAISKDSGWDYEADNYTMQCSDGKLDKAENVIE